MSGDATSSIDLAQRRGYMRRCKRCDGLGEIVIHGAKVVSWACPDCDGSGEVTVHEDPRIS